MEPEGSLPRSQVPVTCPYPGLRSCQKISPGSRPFGTFRNTIRFYGKELLAPSPTLKLKDHPLSAVRDCLFNIFAATLHTGDRYSICNLRTRHAAVTGTHLGTTKPHVWNSIANLQMYTYFVGNRFLNNEWIFFILFKTYPWTIPIYRPLQKR
jgi:hypothetical protein